MWIGVATPANVDTAEGFFFCPRGVFRRATLGNRIAEACSGGGITRGPRPKGGHVNAILGFRMRRQERDLPPRPGCFDGKLKKKKQSYCLDCPKWSKHRNPCWTFDPPPFCTHFLGSNRPVTIIIITESPHIS